MDETVSQGPFAEPTGDIGSINADEVLSSVESGVPQHPMQTAATPAQDKFTSKPETSPSPAQEFEFTWNGKQIKAPKEKVLQWASMGYDYPQRMAELKAQQAEFERRQQEINQLVERYKPVEEFYSQNPDRWERLWADYQNGQTGQQIDPNNPLIQKFQGVESKLSELEQFKQQLLSERLQTQREQEDRQLNEEIQSIRNSYKDLDWVTPSADGKTMEYQVLEYANRNGIRSFSDAFKAFNHDRLVKLAEDRAKEAVVKERQKATKLGLLGEPQAPKKGITNAQDIKNKSYDDLTREVLEELGIA